MWSPTLCLALCILTVYAQDSSSDPLLSSTPMESGYAVTDGIYDNPATNLDATPMLESSPDCTVRPETIVEIMKLRASSSAISKAMKAEIASMGRRKAYIEQLTSYINDRIRDLNKVKSELKQEARWMTASNQKINELAEREHLVKYQDVLACLNTEATALAGASASKKAAITRLQKDSKPISDGITAIQQKINDVKIGATPAP